MKKILSLAILAITTTITSAQIYQGQWMVGGASTFNFRSDKVEDADDDSRTSTFTIIPDVGYFFIDNLAGGLRLAFNSSKAKGDDEAFVYLLAAPFIRYYFLPATQNVNVFADATYGFGTQGTEEKEGINAWGVSAGPAIFLNDRAALEFTLFYYSEGGDWHKDISGKVHRANTLGVNVGFRIHFGAGGRTRTNNNQ